MRGRCSEPGCITILCSANPDTRCFAHRPGLSLEEIFADEIAWDKANEPFDDCTCECGRVFARAGDLESHFTRSHLKASA